MPAKILTQARLKELLHYNPETGALRWRKARSGVNPSLKAGCVFINKNGKKYIRVCVDGSKCFAHRLAWLYANGMFPVHQIDHVDGNGLNNSLSNLRDVSHIENSRNARRNTRNISGVTGVCWDKAYGKWAAQIAVNKRNKNLGRYKYFFDAICARKSAEHKYGFHENHGSVRPL